MCRRFIICCFCSLLLCCCSLGVAMADDVPGDAPVSNPEADDIPTVDGFLRELGFDTENEEEISLFLTWLFQMEPSSEHDMALILSGSDYSELDPGKVYILWQLLQDAVGGTDFYWASDGTGAIANGLGIGYIGWRMDDPGKIYLMQRLPTSAFDKNVPVLGTIDLAQIIADQGYLTQASLTPLEELIKETNSLLSQANFDNTLLYNRLGLVYNLLDQVYVRLGLMFNILGVMDGRLESLVNVSNDMYSAIRGDTSGSIYSFLKRVDTNINYMRYTQLPQYFSFSRSWSYDEATNTIKSAASKSLGVAELLDTNFKDLDSLLLKNFGADSGYSGFYWMFFVPQGSGIFGYLRGLLYGLERSLYSGGLFLIQDGSEYYETEGVGVLPAVQWGFLGLNHNMETALVGGHGGSAQYSQLTFDENLYKETTTVEYTDLLHAIVGIGSDIQNPLSQLQAVLAGDADLELHRNTQQNIDSVTDNFTGSGDGAVSSGDISDASGLTSGIGNAFGGNQVSTGDAFMAATDSGNFDFLSEECAAALDAVAYPAAVVLDADDDSWLDAYVVDEDGFYSVADLSGWSFLDYLGKEG